MDRDVESKNCLRMLEYHNTELTLEIASEVMYNSMFFFWAEES